MYSVTMRARTVKQPRGGYVKPWLFRERERDDEKILAEEENISPAIVGMAVDYLTRFQRVECFYKAFYFSIKGYLIYCLISGKEKFEEEKKAKLDIKSLLDTIKGLDDDSIIAACKLTTYDVWLRNVYSAMNVKEGATEIKPDKNTIENIRIMVERSVSFWHDYGEIVADGFLFSGVDENGQRHNGYTDTVSSGDGDYITKDTMWDFKVSKYKPDSKQTLQLMMYWIMGQHSGMEIFKKINKLGFFNPRLNKVYLLKIEYVDTEVIKQIEEDVICY